MQSNNIADPTIYRDDEEIKEEVHQPMIYTNQLQDQQDMLLVIQEVSRDKECSMSLKGIDIEQ